ncbi:MAG: DinB family protein [Fimbriimonadaceae bacterium]|nr:DinB family protein [Fimbriimonadaceae bacterium]
MTDASELKRAMKGQYHAGLAMLRQCIERCPDDLWGSVTSEHPRTFWRIAYHTIFYTHLYLMSKYEDFVPWEKDCWHGRVLWDDDEEGMPPVETTYTQAELLEYLDLVDRGVDVWVDAIDYGSTESGFSWYSIPKLDHQILNIRHLGIHTGQLQELLYAKGVDLDWVSRRPK